MLKKITMMVSIFTIFALSLWMTEADVINVDHYVKEGMNYRINEIIFL